MEPGKPISKFNQSPYKAASATLLFLVCYSLLSISIYWVTQKNTLGSDFYIFYLAGDAIHRNEDPYSNEIAIQAQKSIYKRLANPDEDQLAFAYPPYALLPVIPLLLLPFEWAQAGWMALCILLLVSAIFYSSTRLNLWLVISALFYYPISFGLILGNFAVPIASILLVCFSALTRSDHQKVSFQILWGVLLAWSSCKPQFSWLFILFLLLLAIRKKQYWVIFSFVIGLTLLFAFSFLILPNWFQSWYNRLINYSEYNQTWLIITFFLTQTMPLKSAIVLTIFGGAAALASTIWVGKRWWLGIIPDLNMLAWIALIIFLFHPRGKSYEQIIYIIPLILWVCRQKKFWSWTVSIAWFGNLLLFAVTFLLSLASNQRVTIIEWPLAGYILWLIWLLITSKPELKPKFVRLAQ